MTYLKSNEEVLSEFRKQYAKQYAPAFSWQQLKQRPYVLMQELEKTLLSLRKADMEAVRGLGEELRRKNKEAKPANHIEEVDERAYDAGVSDLLQQLPN